MDFRAIQCCTGPEVIAKLNYTILPPNFTTATVTWQTPQHQVDEFLTRWWKEGGTVKQDSTQVPTFSINELEPGSKYNIQVACVLNGDIGKYSTIESFLTPPSGPSEVEVSPNLKSPSTSLIIRLKDYDRTGKTYRIEVQSITDHGVNEQMETENLHCIVEGLAPGHFYSISVTATKDKLSGRTLDVKQHVQTYPGRVGNLKVLEEAAKSTSRTVSWDPVFSSSSYVIKFKTPNGTCQVKEAADTNFTLQDLENSQKYIVSVAAKNFAGTGNFSEPTEFSTEPPGFLIQYKNISDRKYLLKWNNVADAKSYIFQWRAEHGIWKDERVVDCEKVLDNLNSGTTFEVKVIPYNEKVKGKESKIIQFTTVPGAPTTVKVAILSTREVEISCEAVTGASNYIFKISGQNHEANEPKFILKHGDETTEFRVTVYAKNISGRGPPSHEERFTQTLLNLQKKFLRNAEKKFAKKHFVELTFTDVQTSRIVNLQTPLEIGRGETTLIQGGHFTGKTALCCYYLQTLNEEKLGIFLDCSEYQNRKTSMDIKELLKRSMDNISDKEMTFVFQWMKEHSDQVAIAIDNLTFPDNYGETFIDYTDKRNCHHLFINLTKVNRGLFPNSRVFCASSDEYIYKVISPTKLLQIYGFDDNQIKMMKSRLLGDENFEIPRHLAYFCVNPSFCTIILKHLGQPTNDPSVDVESYSSVLMKVFKESLDKYPKSKGAQKLKQIVNGIKGSDSKLRTPELHVQNVNYAAAAESIATCSMNSAVPSSVGSTAQRKEVVSSCKLLQDQMFKAFYLSFTCSFENFKENMKSFGIGKGSNASKSSSKTIIMACGLLIERNIKLEKQLFENANFDEKIMKKKLSFIKEKKVDIPKYVVQNPQMALDWCDILYETNSMQGKTSNTIKLQNSWDQNQIDAICHFLRCCRRHTVKPFIQMQYPKNPNVELTLPIDLILKENPNAQGIVKGTVNESTIRMSGSPQRSSSDDTVTNETV